MRQWLERLREFAAANPLIATAVVCVALYAAAALRYDNFFTLRVFLDFFRDNAVVGIVAVGMTFVILTGGIDLSVGAVVGCSTILLASLLENGGMPAPAAWLLVLAGGTLFGGAMGAIIHFLRQPPFLVTLAGMFLARGLGYVVGGLESLVIGDPLYESLSRLHVSMGGQRLALIAMVLLLMVAAGTLMAWFTRFGRTTYAIGGDEHSALLMGLPVAIAKVRVYAFSGFCAALAGIVYTLDTFSGNPNAGALMELDAIAAVVIGGTLLSGGVGGVPGTLLGVLILGIIQTAIVFEGDLSSAWTRIVIGGLLALFILLQKALQFRRE